VSEYYYDVTERPPQNPDGFHLPLARESALYWIEGIGEIYRILLVGNRVDVATRRALTSRRRCSNVASIQCCPGLRHSFLTSPCQLEE
jgi:hypothetical protein